jgi:hypothetical protein
MIAAAPAPHEVDSTLMIDVAALIADAPRVRLEHLLRACEALYAVLIAVRSRRGAYAGSLSLDERDDAPEAIAFWLEQAEFWTGGGPATAPAELRKVPSPGRHLRLLKPASAIARRVAAAS